MVAALPRNMRILPPREAIPIIMDRTRSPVVSLDTEYDSSKPVCQADLRGLSLAGGNPRDGFVGTFFSFDGFGDIPWEYLRDKVLWPLAADPDRTLVMHPPKVDMQPLRARGLKDVQAKIECTFSMAHLYDENLPKALKDLGESVLGIHGLLTHAQTVDKMKKIRKRGDKEVKAILKQSWEVYRDHRKRSKEEEVPIDPSWPSWKRIAMRLPPKMLKRDVVETLGPRIKEVVTKHYDRTASLEYQRYGAIDALLTIGMRYFFVDGVDGVIEGLPDDQQEHLKLETEVCHPVVTEMEERGVKVDVDLLRDIHSACAQAIAELEEDLQARWGVALNRDGDPRWKPGSPDQVGEILWNRWAVRPPPWAQAGGEIRKQFRIKKTGLCSTNDDVLSYLVAKEGPHADDVKMLLDWRSFTKIFGTYVEPMLRMALADPEHRIHSSFWHVGARTGRFSSSDPNLENIPRPTSMPFLRIPVGADPLAPPPGVVVDGKGANLKWRVASLRDVFIAEKGYRFVSADLAQIENRLIAVESKDPVLLRLFRQWDCAECGKSGETNQPLHQCPECGAAEGKRDKSKVDQPPIRGFCLGMDIHSMTAHSIGLPARYRTFDEARQAAKAVNHAFNYGMGARTLARKEGMSRKEAQTHLDNLDKTYPQVRGYLHPRVKRAVRNDGVIVMFDGHKRRFLAPRLLMNSHNFRDWEWEGVIREAVNVLAQGGTGVIVKRAMVRIRARLKEQAQIDARYADVRAVNQVHDEILYEAPEEIADDVLTLVRWEMEHAAPDLPIPVLADGATGKRWGEAH